MQSKNIKQLKEAFKGWREYTSINEQQLSTPGPDDEGGRQLDKTPKMSMSNDLDAFRQAIKDGYEILVPIPDSNLDEVKSKPAPVLTGFFVRTPNGIFYLDLDNLTFNRTTKKVKGVSPEKVLQALEKLAAKGKFDMSFSEHKKFIKELKKLDRAARNIVEVVDAVDDVKDFNKLADTDITREMLKATNPFRNAAKAIYEKFDFIRAWVFGDRQAMDRLALKFDKKYKGMAYKEVATGDFKDKIEKRPTRFTKRQINQEDFKEILEAEKEKLLKKKNRLTKIIDDGYKSFDLPGLRGRDIPGVDPVPGLKTQVVDLPDDAIDDTDPLGTKKEKAKKRLKKAQVKKDLVDAKLNTLDEILEALKEFKPKKGVNPLGFSPTTNPLRTGKRLLKSILKSARAFPKTALIGSIAAGYFAYEIYDEIKQFLGDLGDAYLYSIAYIIDQDPTGVTADFLIDTLYLAGQKVNAKQKSFVSDSRPGRFYTSSAKTVSEYEDFYLINDAKKAGIELRRVEEKDLDSLERLIAKSMNKYLQGQLVSPPTDPADVGPAPNLGDMLNENNKKLKITLGSINESKLVSNNKVLKITIS